MARNFEELRAGMSAKAKTAIWDTDVSKLERRTDMYVSTLASYLQAVAADLEVPARSFPDGRAVKITKFVRTGCH
jgi:hypothetical protein